MTTTPAITNSRIPSAIWLLPFIALCICGWLLYASYKNSGEHITIIFDDATGIVPGKTQVMARGIPVGLVQAIVPDLAHNQVLVQVKIDQQVTDFLVEDTLFWIVRPELSASSVEGLDTILSGAYIGMRPGTSKTGRLEFIGQMNAPPVAPDAPGLHIQLLASELGSIQAGTGVYYRDVKIGTVQRHQLVRDESIMIDLYIEPNFSHLVREGSRFCNASGLQIGGKLPNLKIQMQSLASLLRGGILLYTPDQLQDSPKALNGHVFTLFADYEAANYGIPMTLTLASSEDIVEGSTKIMYRGLEAGFVKEIQINDDDRRSVTAHILLDPRAELILREKTIFWLVKPEISLSGIENLPLLLSGTHITFQPGGGDFRNHFNILPSPPPQTPLRPGSSFTLRSAGPNKLSAKSPVYFKNVPVGQIINIRIGDDGETVETDIYIYQEHLHLLDSTSIFWCQSGLQIDASLAKGVQLDTGPLAKMVSGGVSFLSPSGKKQPPPEGTVFPLYNSFNDAKSTVASLQTPGIRFRIDSREGHSLGPGSPILHKNIQIGEVRHMQLLPKSDMVRYDCFVEKQYQHLIRRKTKFYNTGGVRISGDLSSGFDVQTGSLQSILAGGIACITPEDDSSRGPDTKSYHLFSSEQEALHSDRSTINLIFTNGQGVDIGTEIRFRGMAIGKVQSLGLAPQHDALQGTISIAKSEARLFRTDTRIWIEQAEVGLAGVKNLESIVFGPFLNILPGEGEIATTFTVLASPPLTEIAARSGLGLVLEAPRLGSLGTGSPILYRQVEIGRVTGWRLSPNLQKVFIYIAINQPYQPIIDKNTKFWEVSGTKISGGIFSGVSITTESMSSLLRGGIALATPQTEGQGGAVSTGHHFRLYDTPQSQWLDWITASEPVAGKKNSADNAAPNKITVEGD